jgi:hypothetical protein
VYSKAGVFMPAGILQYRNYPASQDPFSTSPGRVEEQVFGNRHEIIKTPAGTVLDEGHTVLIPALSLKE